MILVKGISLQWKRQGPPGAVEEGANYTLECGHLGGKLSISSFTTWPAQLYAPTKMTSSETLNAADGFVL